MLEQIDYESPRVSERKQVVYVVSDLERLSAVSLSYGTGGSSGSSSGSGGGFSMSGFNGKAPSGGRPLPSLSDFVNEARTKAPSSGLPKPSLIGTYSDFSKASEFGIGPGIVDTSRLDADTQKYLERYRAPETDKEHGEHMNLLSYLPGKTKPFFNLHIDFNEEE